MRTDIDGLRALVRHHERKYYIENQPEISDTEFDALMKELEALEAATDAPIPPDSPTQRVGGRCRIGHPRTASQSDAESKITVMTNRSCANLRSASGDC